MASAMSTDFVYFVVLRRRHFVAEQVCVDYMASITRKHLEGTEVLRR